MFVTRISRYIYSVRYYPRLVLERTNRRHEGMPAFATSFEVCKTLRISDECQPL
jgi:hypothetical protein